MGFLWYGLPDATELWQPVDAGYTACLKNKNWLDIEDNSEQWFCNEKPYSTKERRIFIAKFAGKAFKKNRLLKIKPN